MNEEPVIYFTYCLFNFDGAGHQPYNQGAMLGLDLDCGLVKRDSWYLGRILKTSSATNIKEAIKGLSAWGAKLITVEQAEKMMNR